jgi:FlaA1/EpsC-like NDP-sugar epimerase
VNLSTVLRNPSIDPAQNRRAFLLVLIYAGVAATSFYLAFEVRFDFLVPAEFAATRLQFIAFVVAIKLLALIAARQLGSLMTYFSIPDFMRLMWAMLSASLLLFAMRVVSGSGQPAPRGVLLIDFMLCSGALCAGRLAARMFRERLAGSRHLAGSVVQVQRIAIIGAGDAGASLAKEFLTNPARGFKPVVFFDDDATKHGKLVHGVPVVGTPEAIDTTKGLHSLAKVVIAMPTAPAKRVRQVVQLMAEHGLKVETLPSLTDLAAGRVRASRIRPVEVQDLLGRETVDLDSEGIRKSVQGRVVMVTGAGGSIGSELCRQIAALAPNRLLLVEQSEPALFTIEQELNELGVGKVATPLVADVLDEERMRYIFAHYVPEVVFHAAAHKHVYLMERQPAEAIRNNVLGTRLLAQISAEFGVDRFVLISTDKAINPTSVMGATKRLAEIQLLAIAAAQNGESPRKAEKLKTETLKHEQPIAALHPEAQQRAVASSGTKTIGFNAAEQSVARSAIQPDSDFSVSASQHVSVSSSWRRSRPTKFMSVRFGNVLGSSGSVIPIFKRQIANGGPVTVTHPDVTRYFMTIPEAVGLVLQTSILGQGGEIFVLDMGQPVKIIDLARQMIELSGFKVGDDIEIKFTGLKPGEKLFEELQHKTEQYTATEHPRIMRFTTTTMISESGVKELKQRLYELDANALKHLLKRVVPEYTPFLD